MECYWKCGKWQHWHWQRNLCKVFKILSLCIDQIELRFWHVSKNDSSWLRSQLRFLLEEKGNACKQRSTKTFVVSYQYSIANEMDSSGIFIFWKLKSLYKVESVFFSNLWKAKTKVLSIQGLLNLFNFREKTINDC